MGRSHLPYKCTIKAAGVGTFHGNSIRDAMAKFNKYLEQKGDTSLSEVLKSNTPIRVNFRGRDLEIDRDIYKLRRARRRGY